MAKTKVTPAKLMKLAEEMIDFMTKRDLFYIGKWQQMV